MRHPGSKPEEEVAYSVAYILRGEQGEDVDELGADAVVRVEDQGGKFLKE